MWLHLELNSQTTVAKEKLITSRLQTFFLWPVSLSGFYDVNQYCLINTVSYVFVCRSQTCTFCNATFAISFKNLISTSPGPPHTKCVIRKLPLWTGFQKTCFYNCSIASIHVSNSPHSIPFVFCVHYSLCIFLSSAFQQSPLHILCVSQKHCQPIPLSICLVQTHKL